MEDMATGGELTKTKIQENSVNVAQMGHFKGHPLGVKVTG